MPSRKQRRRREKERRHEYELVLVDETGEERPIDSEELRAKRREKDAGRGKDRARDGKGAGRQQQRPIREVKPPSWNRVWKRGAFFAVFMFVVLSFVGGKHGTLASRLVPTLLYTVLFIPFLYLLDRVQYNQYLRRSGQQPPSGGAGRGSGTTKTDDGERKGLLGNFRFRR